MSYEFVEPILYWYRMCVGRDIGVDDITPKELPRDHVPDRYRECLKALWRMNRAARVQMLLVFKSKFVVEREVRDFSQSGNTRNEDSGVFEIKSSKRIDFNSQVD